jgi:NDP-sugar pyrophosphorylase family protein
VKALILAGGKGSRLLPNTASRNKCLLEVGGKKLIEYSLQNAAKLKAMSLLSAAVVVIGYKGYQVRDFLGSSYSGLRIEFVEQRSASALGAIASARGQLPENEPFLLMFGDEILIEPRLDDMLRVGQSGTDGVVGYCGARRLEDVKRTYSIETDEKNVVTLLVEKPRTVKNSMMGTGNCILPYDFLDWTERVTGHGVQDFVTCVQYAVGRNRIFLAFEVCSRYFNVNEPQDYNEAVRALG